MFTVQIDDQITPLLEDMIGTTGNVMERLVRETGEVLTPFLHQNAPVGKRFMFDGTELPGGQLRDSLHFEMGQFGSKLVGAKQGIFVIGGTRPHRIAPRGAHSIISTREEVQAKPRLAFFWPKVGHGVRPKAVNHPGTKANDFRMTALQQAFDENVIQEAVGRIMTQWVAGGSV